MFGYCSVQEVYLVFGKRNVLSWADIDNQGPNSVEINERVEYFISVAADQINARLRNRAYADKLQEYVAAGNPGTPPNFPFIIKHLNAVIAGLLMFDARVTNYSAEEPQQSLRTYRQWSESVIENLNSGSMKLGGEWESVHRTAPEVVYTNVSNSSSQTTGMNYARARSL
jgi:hypothetical protein